MVSVTSEAQFYIVAHFAVPISYVGNMYDTYKDNSVIIVDVDKWYYVNFEQSLGMKEEFGYQISFEEFKMRYLETVPVDKIMTHDDEVKSVSDMINHPSHYKQFSREVIDTMADISTNEEFKGYLKLNAIKYLSRYQSKNGVEDLEKAIWYVTKLRDVLKKEAME